ncbi:MAG: C45 family autoproteolytic acyltransferase/hydrolase [Candidatus Odinarchaeota archaeon]
MVTAPFFPLLEVSGTHYEIGTQIGRKFKEKIHKGFTESRGVKQLLEWDRLKPERLDKVEQLGKKYFPRYMDEITGIADGSGMDYRKVLAVNFMHVPFVERKDKVSTLDEMAEENCSTAIFRFPDHKMVCHNEDLDPVLGKYSYFLHYKLADGSSFLAFAYCGCIPGLSFGFNSYGIVKTCNSLSDPYKKMGIPRILFGRSILEAKSLSEAVTRTQQHSPRSGGASYNLVSLHDDQAVNVETTSISAAITPITGRYFRTNHYISDRLKKHLPPDDYGFTVERYVAGLELLPRVEKSEQGILKILLDPRVFIDPEKTKGRLATVCTAIFKISKTIDLRVYLPGTENEEYQRFSSDNLL